MRKFVQRVLTAFGLLLVVPTMLFAQEDAARRFIIGGGGTFLSSIQADADEETERDESLAVTGRLFVEVGPVLLGGEFSVADREVNDDVQFNPTVLYIADRAGSWSPFLQGGLTNLAGDRGWHAGGGIYTALGGNVYLSTKAFYRTIASALKNGNDGDERGVEVTFEYIFGGN